MAERSIAARALEPLCDRLESVGVDSSRLLRARGVDPASLERDDARLPIAVSDRLWEDAAEAADDPSFALHLAESIDPRSFGLLTYLAGSSATVGDSLRRLSHHYAVLSSAAAYRLESRGDRAELIVDLQRTPDRPRQVVEFLVAVAYCFTRGQSVEPWTAGKVWFTHPAPVDSREHRRIFNGAELCFGAGRCGFDFGRWTLDLPLRRADPRLLAILEHHASTLSRAPAADGLIAQVRAAQSAALAVNTGLDAEAIARALGTSPRSLRRRLAEAGTSYSTVLDQLRREMAVSLLDAGRPPASVGLALGFSDERAFGRAFRRWFGVTPTAYRKARAESQAPVQ